MEKFKLLKPSLEYKNQAIESKKSEFEKYIAK